MKTNSCNKYTCNISASCQKGVCGRGNVAQLNANVYRKTQMFIAWLMPTTLFHISVHELRGHSSHITTWPYWPKLKVSCYRIVNTSLEKFKIELENLCQLGDL